MNVVELKVILKRSSVFLCTARKLRPMGSIYIFALGRGDSSAINRQADEHTIRWTDEHTNRWTDRQTDNQGQVKERT